MNLTTFKSEKIINQQDLIIKSLFILVFTSEAINTNKILKLSRESDRLLYLHSMLKPSNHLFVSVINPVEYTFISKQLVQPKNREGIDEDFDKVDTNLLLEYLQSLNAMSFTIALN